MWWLLVSAFASDPPLTAAVRSAMDGVEAEIRACVAGAPDADQAEIQVTYLHDALHVTVFPASTGVVVTECVERPLLRATDLRAVRGSATAIVKLTGDGFTVRPGATPEAPVQPGWVSRAVRRHARALDRCGEAYVARGGTARTADVTVWVSPEGAVTEAGVTRGAVDPEAKTCIAGVFSEMRFKPPKGSTAHVVTWPLDFSD